MLEDASTLLSQKQELETEKQLLEAFEKHFVVSEDDLLVLTVTTETVNDRFFAILKRVKNIYVDCQVLLGSENQRLGLELMDQSSRNLNLGYQKLYRWIQKEFRTLNLENPQISSIIRRALRALAERPTLFQSCLDSFAESREHVLTDAFYAALTGSSTGSDQDQLTKPIEFYAHDPLRYVGDMLAWTHSTTVSEREALETLFVSEGEEISKGLTAGKDAEPWSAEDADAFDGRKALGDLVNRNISGIARALRQQIEQLMQNHQDAVLLYKIANLVNFYRITFNKLLNAESTLLQTFSLLEESAMRHFRTLTTEAIVSIEADLFAPSSDLRIPDFLDQNLIQFSALLKCHDSSLASAESRIADFAPVISQVLDPLVSACQEMVKDSHEPEKSIFLMNCMLATQATLGNYDFVQERKLSLDDEIESLISTLTDYQHAFFLHTSGVHPLLAALAPIDESPDALLTVPNLPPFQSQPLTDASQVLDEFLPSALMDAMENLKRLNNTKVAQAITAEAAERFCEDFEFVEGKLGAVDALREGKEARSEGSRGKVEMVMLRSLYPRTSGETRVLLS